MKRIRGVCVAEVIWKCKFVKTGSEIRESHDLRTHLNRKRDITGNLSRIWMIKSWGTYSVSFFSMPLPLVIFKESQCEWMRNFSQFIGFYLYFQDIYRWMRKYKNGECEKHKSYNRSTNWNFDFGQKKLWFWLWSKKLRFWNLK
jgi:hypothetical protein